MTRLARMVVSGLPHHVTQVDAHVTHNAVPILHKRAPAAGVNQAVIRPHCSRTSPGIVIQIRRRRGIRGICRRAHVVVAVDLDQRDLPELTLVNEALFCLDQVRRATALQTNLDNAIVVEKSRTEKSRTDGECVGDR